MGRIRTIKPDLLIHEGLQELEMNLRLPVILVFVGLLTQADREGRFRWKPRTLKLAILPFMHFDMEEALNGLHAGGYIRKYETDGEVYGDIPTFAEHQRVNAHESKSDYPAYEDAHACTCISPDGKQMHMHARGEGKGREGRRKGKGKGKEIAPTPSVASASPVFLTIPLVGGSDEHAVTEADLDELGQLFPAVDVRQAVREVRAWNDANPTKRKTVTGVRDHIRRWLAKMQNEGGRNGATKGGGSSEGARGAAVGRVERGIAAVNRAAEQFGWTEAGGHGDADGRLLPASGDGGGNNGGVSARPQQTGRETRAAGGENRAADVAHQARPEVLPPSERSSRGARSHGD